MNSRQDNTTMAYLHHYLKCTQLTCVFLVISTLMPFTGIGQHLNGTDGALKFENISDGLSSNYILDICQDSKGYLWFATDYGLNRFDGLNFKLYINNPDDSTSISQDNIYKLLVDSRDRLWVGTQSGGLNLYNRDLDNFTRFVHDKNNPGSINHNSIREIYEDPQRSIWIGTKKGLVKYNEANRSFLQYNKEASGYGKPVNNIRAMLMDQQGNFWIGATGGLFLFDPKSGNFQLIPQHTNDQSDPSYRCLFEDSNGTIWGGSAWGGGLKKIERNGTYSITTFLEPAENDYLGASRNNILSIEEYANHLWIGTENGGLKLMNLDTEHSVYEVNDYKEPTSISSNSIWSIFKDNSNRVWLGTYNKGVSMWDPNRNDFNHQLGRNQLQFTEGNNIVTSFAVNNGEIWVGTDGGGLFKLDKSGNLLKKFKNEPGNSQSLSSNSVLDLFLQNNEILWVATWEGGLCAYNLNTDRFAAYRKDINGNPVENIFSIYPDDENNLWIGSWGSGLFHFDTRQQSFTPVHYADTADFPGLDPFYANNIYLVYTDQNNQLWVGGMFGLYRSAPNDSLYQSFEPIRMSSSENLEPIVAQTLHEHSNGIIWIGTVGDGLIKYDPKNETFRTYTLKNGLAGNSVKKILEDENGSLWISTNQGISKFNVAAEAFKNFAKEDGLQENEFFKGSGFKAKDGRLFFGGINGFNSFHSKDIQLIEILPPVYLTDLKVFNQSVPVDPDGILPRQLSELSEITLSYRESVFSLYFQALNFTYPEKTQYAYRLDGLETRWNFVTNINHATYTNLDPGTYTFMVKASNSDGLWNENEASLTIHITPPWWRTTLFYVAMVILMATAVVVIVNSRNRYLTIQKEQLKKLVNERTAALTTSNEQLQNTLNELKQTQNKLIKSEKITALSQVVFNLLHELNSPLGSTKAGLEYIKKDVLLEVQQLPKLMESLDASAFEIFKNFLEEMLSQDHYYSPSEERQLTSELQQTLQKMNIEDQQILESLAVIQCFKLSDNARKLLSFKNAPELIELAEMIILKYHNLANMDKSVERSINILNSLRTYTEDETPDIKYPVDIIQSIEDCLKLREHVFKRGVKVIREYMGRPTILANNEELKQVWLNIISNANYAMNYSGELTITVIKNEIDAHVSFKDNGPGIPKDKLDKVFEPFYTTKPLGEGRGIGLDIVKKLVSKHGGTISLTSEPGNTQFAITLPLFKETRENPSNQVFS